MYRRFFLCLLLVLLPLARLSGASLTLEEAFDVIEHVNVNVLLSREAITQAIAFSEQQRVSLLPRVSFDAQQRRSQTVTITNDVPIQNSTTNRFDGKITGTYAFLTPGQIVAYRAAKRGIGVAEFDYKQTLQSILAAVANAFFTHLRNVQRIVVLDSNTSRAKVLLGLAKRQLEAGVATQIDVTRAESQLAIAEQARLQQDTVVYQSELQLKRILDQNPGSPFGLADFVVRRTDQTLFTTANEQTVFEQRYDYLRTRALLGQNKEDLRATKLDRFGSLSLFGEYGRATTNIFDGNDKTAWVGGIELNVPVFDGGRIGANQRAALSRLRSQEYRLRSVELLISTEVRLASQDARSRNFQVDVAERGVRLAEDELRLAEKRYEQGVADNREVIDAQNRLAVASDNLVDAIYQYNLSRLELSRAKGEVKGILKEKSG